MAREKSHTKMIFDDLEATNFIGSYGYLSATFRVFASMARIRSKSRMTQMDLAKATGISRETIAKIESGLQNPTIKQLVKIAHAFGTRIGFIELTEKEKAAFKDADMESYQE